VRSGGASKAVAGLSGDDLSWLVRLGASNRPIAKSEPSAPQARRRRAQPEAAIQRAVIAHLGWRAPPDCFYFHPANGGYRSRIEAAILSGLGVVAGVPDVIIVYRGRVFALEVKAEDGRLTAAQIACHARLREAGAIVGVAVGIDAALDWLERNGLLRRVVR
jgi:hypothetical protein